MAVVEGRAVSEDLRVGWVLYRRDLAASLGSPAIYLIVTAACLLLAVFVGNYMDTVDKLAVIVSADPARIPMYFAAAFMSLCLGITTSVSISSEREQRTLEVLFYGPVTPTARVLSLFLRDVTLFLLAICTFLLDLWVASRLTNLSIGPYTLASAGYALLLVWPMIGFSLLLSSAIRRVRRAVLTFVAVFVGLAGLQLARSLLLAVPAESASLFLLYARETLARASSVVQWISPFAYIARLNDTILTGSTSGIGPYLGAAVLFTAALLSAAIVVLKRMDKGS